MLDERRIQLTEPAEKRLSSVVDGYREEILDIIRRENFVPGEDLTEVTASNVDDAVRRLRYGRTRRTETRKFQAQLFLWMGLALLSVGIGYPFFRDMLSNPVQMVLTATGAYVLLAGVFYYRVLALRFPDNRDKDDDLREKVAGIESSLRELKKSQAEPEDGQGQ